MTCDPLTLKLSVAQWRVHSVRLCQPPAYVAPPPYVNPGGGIGGGGGGGGGGDLQIPSSSTYDVVATQDDGVINMNDYAEDYFGEDYVGLNRTFT